MKILQESCPIRLAENIAPDKEYTNLGNSFIYNQLFFRNISQLREEKCHRRQLL